MSANSVLSTLLLSLQLCLGFWQIGKLTPAGALIQCSIGWLLYQCSIGRLLYLCRLYSNLSDDYRRLKGFKGRIYKIVRCHVTTDQPNTRMPRKNTLTDSIHQKYLGEEFCLERRGEANKLYVNGDLRYYITDNIWTALMDFAEAAPETAFLKGYKEFWQQVATGGVMSLSEVLDCLILENHTVRVLDNDLLLPVNLSVSEEKVLKVLNLVGLFLQTRKVPWQAPLLLSLTSALLEFTTTVRVFLYGKINQIFCWGMHWLCDGLRRSVRRQVYSLGNWVENLKPSNDLKLRVVRGRIRAVIGGGARIGIEGAVRFEEEGVDWVDGEGGNGERRPKTIPCGAIDEDYRPIDIECWFSEATRRCHLRATTVALADVECDAGEFVRLYQFLKCVARNRSGSLKSLDADHRARFRGFREAVACYSKSGFPPVYELWLDGVIGE